MQIFLLISLVIILVEAKIADYNVIDLSDILNVDYMPGSLLVLENADEKQEFRNDTTEPVFGHRGTFDTAFATMGYHRKMMNEYLCRSYVSEQIITEMKSTRIRRRLGNPAEISTNLGTPSSKINYSLKNNLLEDEGSSNYQDWLKKSATLEDIYRHYDSAQNREAPENSRDAEQDSNEEFDAHVTGYGYQQPQSSSSPSKLGYGGTGGGYSYHPSGGVHSSGSGAGGGLYGGSSGYGTGGSYFGGPSDHMIYGGGGSGHGYGGGHEHTPKHHGGHDDKDKLADLFDIALTALAYLSFGMFIIQVIMCISMANTTTAPAMTMMPMSLNPTGVDPTGGMMAGGDGMNGGGNSNGGNTSGGGTTDGDVGGESTIGGGTDGGTGNAAPGGDGDGNDNGDTENTTDSGDGSTGGGTAGDGATADGNPDPGPDGNDAGNIDGDSETTDGGENNRVVFTEANTHKLGIGSDDIFATGMSGAGGDITGEGNEDFGGINGGIAWGGNGDFGTGGSGVTGGGTTAYEDGATTADGSVGAGGTGETGGTSTGGTGDTGDGRDATRYKKKRRDIPVITQPNNEALNELARRILISIEAALVAHQDDGNCLRKTLCENNVYSRSLQSNQKYWMPVWSLGMSWLSGRIVQNVPRATSMLDSLKASLLGLGKADCEILYHDCDMAKERQKRQRRRRKRSTH